MPSHFRRNSKLAHASLAAGVVLFTALFSASGQTGGKSAAPATAMAKPAADEVSTQAISKPGTLRKMTRAMTIDFTDTRLEDAIQFIADFTGADLEPLWAANSGEGLDKELPITMKVKNMSAMAVLERLLDKSKTEFSENTWQMTEDGALEFGPKSLLNKSKRIEIYDIHDLLFEIKRYPTVPQIDLQSLLQQSQGGGGGSQSPFDDQDDEDDDDKDDAMKLERKGQELITLIVGLVEPDQWNDGGGDGGTIKYYSGTLLVNAADYIHRNLGGYKWWPAGYKTTQVADRRYVSLNMGAEHGTIDGIRNFPVAAVVPGGAAGGGGGGGGGDPPGGGKEVPAPKGSKTTAAKTPAATKPTAKPTTKAKAPIKATKLPPVTPGGK